MQVSIANESPSPGRSRLGCEL